ncbi:MAG: histidine kinase dimerization/phospho-acceptor domain-containing protein, partial [Casimicrobiaceae bacterium]
MLRRLPYRLQIPLGLSLAVVLAAIVVTAVIAREQAQQARSDILMQLERAVVLLTAQVRPMLADDDVWRIYTLLRDTARLIPGAEADLARLAVLSADGTVVAASDPTVLHTSKPLLGQPWRGRVLARAEAVEMRQRLDWSDGSVVEIDPIRSEDGQSLGFVFTEVEAPVFAPDWMSLARIAAPSIALAVAALLPLGWWAGERMARPVGQLAWVIDQIGRRDTSALAALVPKTRDPELDRIGKAVSRLIDELERRRVAEERALSAERLAAVGKLTAAVAHEINNPLAGLLTATRTLGLHGENKLIRERTVDLLERGLQQIRSTVTALLPQARIEDRALRPEDLEDVVTLVQPMADQQGIRIAHRVDVASPLQVPSAPLRQVMLNLLLNALNAAGAHGRVEACLQADASWVRFTVGNSG